MYVFEGTSNCIVCGEPAKIFHGHVKAKETMGLGHTIDVKLIAGFCNECDGTVQSNNGGCYGEYDNEKHGYCKDIRQVV